MTYDQFKKLIAEGSDIDHETALKMIELMWPTLQKCEDLMQQECVDDGDEVNMDIVVGAAGASEEVSRLANKAHWVKKSTQKTQVVNKAGEIIGEAG